jgi:ABC-type multidrug transport system fused ATPase/permease subunit
MAILMTIMGLVIPEIIQRVLDHSVESRSIKTLLLGTGIITVIFFVKELFNCLRIRINNTLEQKVLIDIRKDLHDKLLDLPVSFYDNRKSGDIASRVIEDVTNVERVILDGTEQGSVAILTVIGVTLIMFTKEPLLAVFVFLPLPILVFMGKIYGKLVKFYWKKVRDTSGDLSSLLVEDIQGNRLIHAFALKNREKKRFLEKSEELKKCTLDAMYRWSLYSPGSAFITNLGTVAVVGVGGYLLFSRPESFTFGEFSAFLIYTYMFYEPVRTLNGLNHMINTGKASGERVFEILDFPEEVQSPTDPKSFPNGVVEIEYRDVQFGYENRNEILPALNVVLPAGKVTALVGHTGAGKSTIANLLLRYYDVISGSVLINGVSVRDLSLESLRSNIGIVSQDPFLFDASIRENMLVAKSNATDEEIIQALDSASIYDFVKSLPDQLDAMIGERGIRLSMGEKQRITIARVLLRNPPIVILDEATSAVDTLTERKIQDGLSNLMKNRTVLVIAHRLSTVREADQIIVLEQGQIIEQGTHDELLVQGGHYSSLWNEQANIISEV